MSQRTYYVDKLSDDETLGLTNTPETIAHNNRIIGFDLVDSLTKVLDESGQGHYCLYNGRYIIVGTVSLENHTYGMIFLDLKKDENKAKEACNQLKGASLKKQFMEAFYSQIEEYDQIYDSVRLVVKKPSS